MPAFYFGLRCADTRSLHTALWCGIIKPWRLYRVTVGGDNLNFGVTMDARTEQITQRINDYINDPIVNDYKQFITLKNVPLAERWSVFKMAPISWKDAQSWIMNFEIEQKLDCEIDWFDEFYFERRETVNMIDFVERLQWELEYDGGPSEKMKRGGWTKELIEEFMEEIMQKNLGSFDLDW